MRPGRVPIEAFVGLWLSAGPAFALDGPTPLTTVRVASPLSSPVFVTHAPGDFQRLFLVEQTGRIKILKNEVVLPTPFLNLDPISSSGGERGLLGLAFHPDYARNGFFFVDYTDNNGDTVVARYRVSADPDIADPASATQMLWIDQPASNHNGGWIAFGPDGYLYMATGDGGGAFDSDNNAQTISGNLLGKLLRIDVDGDDFPDDAARNYAVPPDNPFVGVVGDDEVWAYGLRNPWRCAFDRLTGELYIADVGQDTWEEIDFQAAGAGAGRNYGWRCMEAFSCTGRTGCTCDDPSLTLPIHEYIHGGAPFRCSITGGEVYRGCAIPDLHGTYFFADFCSDQIWSFQVVDGTVTEFMDRTAELAPGGGLGISDISSFGTDAAGELYICDLSGEVFKIVPAIGPSSLSLIGSKPPDGAIDAGQPFEPDGSRPTGWSSVILTLDGCSESLVPGDFALSQVGGTDPPPGVATVARVAERAVRVDFSGSIAREARTTIRHVASGTATTLAWLPGDVNSNGVRDPADLAALADHLLGVSGPRPMWSVDVDRSGLATPADLLREIDLLVGGGAYEDLDPVLP